MKKAIFIIIGMAMMSGLFAQSEETTFLKKGRWLVEQGTNANGLFNDGSIFNINLDMGKFVTENFALKVKGSVFFGDAEGYSIGLAAKNYFGGKLPFEIGAQYYDQSEQFLFNANFGYASKLAQNVYLEPSFGIITNEDFNDVLFNPKITFAMIL